MSVARLLALAPDLVQREAKALTPLLEKFFSNLSEGKEPLDLPANSLNPDQIDALKALPVVLESSPNGSYRLWSAKAHGQQQRVLAQLCGRMQANQGLLVVGGAGSGKTSLVRELLKEAKANSAIALMAPTGKATARLREAIAPLKTGMACGTIHRWLEASGDGTFRRGSQKPLNIHTAVVDEFSMVDMALLEALLAALPSQGRLILLGDPGQLAPIAGPGALAPLRVILAAKAPECLVELRGSHRFNQNTTLGKFVQKLRYANLDLDNLCVADKPFDKDTFNRLIDSQQEAGNFHRHNLNLGWPKELLNRIEIHKQALLNAAENNNLSDTDALKILEELLVLAPRRKGRYGVDQLNERWLGIDPKNQLAWPVGTPLLITRNNNERGLSNGDLGLIRADGKGGKIAAIASGEGAKRIRLELLDGVEPALAITVHKSQGSQAKQVIVFINDPEGLDPKLLYTALTRAQERADLLCPM
jgi:exodeoxyribonuclease V alpha subunit